MSWFPSSAIKKEASFLARKPRSEVFSFAEETVDTGKVACERIVGIVPLLVDGGTHSVVEPVVACEDVIDDGIGFLAEPVQTGETLLPVTEDRIVEDDALAVFLQIQSRGTRLPVEQEDVLAVVELLFGRLTCITVIEGGRLYVARENVDIVSELIAYGENLHELRSERIEQYVVVGIVLEELLKQTESVAVVPYGIVGVPLKTYGELSRTEPERTCGFGKPVKLRIGNVAIERIVLEMVGIVFERIVTVLQCDAFAYAVVKDFLAGALFGGQHLELKRRLVRMIDEYLIRKSDYGIGLYGYCVLMYESV